jgi:hypothetical protein
LINAQIENQSAKPTNATSIRSRASTRCPVIIVSDVIMDRSGEGGAVLQVRPVITAVVFAVAGLVAIPGCNRSDSSVAPGASHTVTVAETPTLCEQPPDTEVFGIADLVVAGDRLKMDLQFFGGCGAHAFRMCWSGDIVKGDTPWVNIFVSHDSGGDPCKETLRAEVEFDLTPLRIDGHRQVGLALQDAMFFYKY